MENHAEIFVVPFFGMGHLFPSQELCNHLSTNLHHKTTIIVSSDLSSAVSTVARHPLVAVAEIAAPLPPPPKQGSKPGPDSPFFLHFKQFGEGIETLLESRSENNNPTLPAFAVVDTMMLRWCKEIFAKFGIPVVAFFTCSACVPAMEYAAWKADAEYIQPGETRVLPGLPGYMALSYSDHNRNTTRQPVPNGSGERKNRSFPTEPGDEPNWVQEIEGAVGCLVNTCDELERAFLDYITAQTGLPVWAAGPLLPENFWKLTGHITSDCNIRPSKQSNCSEDHIAEWLNSKPRGSVIYVSFGSDVKPTVEEQEHLANALENSNRSFIWVIQTGLDNSRYHYPEGLDKRVGERGLVIRGWAPQLLILSHSSLGGFLTHCGWNSITEAIVRGVPFLTWPIRGDQFYNAKLVVDHLKIGYKIANEMSKSVKKDDIVRGIESVMTDKVIQERAESYRAVFKDGFPSSSTAALIAFKDFISQKAFDL